MTIGKPFLIDVTESEIENHIAESEMEFPFEFSSASSWDQSFFAPEISSGNTFDLMRQELSDIKQLLYDIKQLLCDMFEVNKKTDQN